jgi:hypothetical protein
MNNYGNEFVLDVWSIIFTIYIIIPYAICTYSTLD